MLNQSQLQTLRKKIVEQFRSFHTVIIAAHVYTKWITCNKLLLFEQLGVNQNFIYFNPAASIHIIPTEPPLPYSITTEPSSKTRAILRWLKIIDI